MFTNLKVIYVSKPYIKLSGTKTSTASGIRITKDIEVCFNGQDWYHTDQGYLVGPKEKLHIERFIRTVEASSMCDIYDSFY